MATGHLLDKSLCATCSHNVIVYFLMAGRRTEGRDCDRHIRWFPEKTECADYEREAGVD